MQLQGHILSFLEIVARAHLFGAGESKSDLDKSGDHLSENKQA